MYLVMWFVSSSCEYRVVLQSDARCQLVSDYYLQSGLTVSVPVCLLDK